MAYITGKLPQLKLIQYLYIDQYKLLYYNTVYVYGQEITLWYKYTCRASIFNFANKSL